MTVDSSQERYRVEREIGHGAMGQVWLAIDTLLDRPVAVKYPLVTSSVSVGQLLQEARMLAQLNHPNITTLYDFFVEPGTNRFYLVMEYVDGKSLDTIIEGGYRLSLEVSLELAQGILRALIYAHGQGVIHRDVKPANVMIGDNVKLTDFGLANLTALLERGTGFMAGTPAYMAPEQIEGRPTDGRADLYSLGVTLFELLSGGQLPFDYADDDKTMEAHLHASPPPLSQFAPDIPPALEQIILRLLAKDPAERYPTAEAVMDGLEALHLGPKLGNLPVPLTLFVGRKVELAEIQDSLKNPACRLLTLVGPGGSGKTRLAIEAAAAQVDNYAHGVFFVSLAPLDAVDSLVPAVAEALGFHFYEEGTPQQQLLDYVRQKHMLLIMDNFEHLVEGAGLTVEILQIAAEVKILVTSRARLNVQGEHLFPVEGMSVPEREIDEDATKYSAVRLFLSSVRRVQPKYEPSADDLTDIARICRLVEGIPLGILLAAAWLEMLTLVEIATEIGQNLDFLETDSLDVPARQRSLRAVFDHSWNLLTEREEEVFQVLSIFRGGFTRQAAQKVTGVSLPELMALVHKSLLRRLPRGRYDMAHELLRQYAAEKLDQSPDACEAAFSRHSAYYCAALQQWSVDLKGSRQQTALAEMDVEIENARDAWDWALERANVEQLDQAIVALCRYYGWRGRYQEAETVCRVAADKLATMEFESPKAAGDGQRVLAQVLSVRSTVNWSLGRTDLCSQLLKQSMALLERSGLDDRDTRLGKAYTLLEMGHVASDSDRVEARRFYEQSLTLFRASDDRWGMALALYSLGEITQSLGTYVKARRFHEESLAIRQALGDQRMLAASLAGLGAIAIRQGEFEEAERLLRQSIAIHQEIGNRGGIADSLSSLGTALIFLGKFAEAASLFVESIAVHNELGSRRRLAFSTLGLGHAKAHLGQYEQARAQAQLGLTLSREIGYQRGIGHSYWVLGIVELAEQAYAEAEQCLQESITALRELGQREELGSVLGFLGIAACGKGHLSQARQHICEALQTASELRGFAPSMSAIRAVVLLLADQGKEEQAVELYTLVSRYPVVANSRWSEDIAGRHIAAVAATLSPDVVVVAQKRGKARDLDTTVVELLTELS